MGPISNKFIILTVILGCFIIILIFTSGSNRKKFAYDFITGKTEPVHVFFDLGANIGDSASMFVDPKFPFEHPLRGYGSLNGNKWIIHSFEANPVHNPKLDEAHKFIEGLGHEHYIYKQTAAWINNEKMTFYLDMVNAKKHFWGSSLHKEHRDARRSGFRNITVNSVDIAELIKQYDEFDEIVLKIDIEGSEYPMINHLIRTGAIYLVDYILIEFHNVKVIGNMTFEEYRVFAKSFFKIFGIKYTPWYLGHKPFNSK